MSNTNNTNGFKRIARGLYLATIDGVEFEIWHEIDSDYVGKWSYKKWVIRQNGELWETPFNTYRDAKAAIGAYLAETTADNPAAVAGMTPEQTAAVEYIRQQITRYHIRNTAHEFKSFEVKRLTAKSIVVCLQTGLKNDDGTAAMLTRQRFQIFVGLRGGLSAYNTNGYKIHGQKVFRAYI